MVPSTDDSTAGSPFAEDSSKLSSIVSQLPSVHHNRTKRQRRSVEEPAMPMMPLVNDIFPETSYLPSSSSIIMPIQQLQGIPVNQPMIQLQTLPLPMTSVLSSSQSVSQPSQLVQTVDAISLEQPSVDPHALQHPVVLQETLKQEIKQEMDGKAVTFQLCPGAEDPSVDHAEEMDSKRVKDCLYTV